MAHTRRHRMGGVHSVGTESCDDWRAYLGSRSFYRHGGALLTYLSFLLLVGLLVAVIRVYCIIKSPDDTVSNLFKSFATEGHLIVNYSTTAAWG